MCPGAVFRLQKFCRGFGFFAGSFGGFFRLLESFPRLFVLGLQHFQVFPSCSGDFLRRDCFSDQILRRTVAVLVIAQFFSFHM